MQGCKEAARSYEFLPTAVVRSSNHSTVPQQPTCPSVRISPLSAHGHDNYLKCCKKNARIRFVAWPRSPRSQDPPQDESRRHPLFLFLGPCVTAAQRRGVALLDPRPQSVTISPSHHLPSHPIPIRAWPGLFLLVRVRQRTVIDRQDMEMFSASLLFFSLLLHIPTQLAASRQLLPGSCFVIVTAPISVPVPNDQRGSAGFTV